MPRKLTDEHKKAISDAHKGKPKSEETRRKMSEAHKGRAKTPEHVEKIASKLRGKKRDPLLVEQHRRWMLEHAPNRGKSPSEETKGKLRAVNLGKSTRLYRYGITDERYASEIAAGNRWCFFRKHFVPLSEFNDGAGCCNGCRSDHYRKGDLARKYNLTHEQYEAILAAQGGGCAICGSSDPGPRNRHMMIDHDHATGKVRGILCSPCNTAVERLETVSNWGLRAAHYLTSPLHQENGAVSVAPPAIGMAP